MADHPRTVGWPRWSSDTTTRAAPPGSVTPRHRRGRLTRTTYLSACDSIWKPCASFASTAPMSRLCASRETGAGAGSTACSPGGRIVQKRPAVLTASLDGSVSADNSATEPTGTRPRLPRSPWVIPTKRIPLSRKAHALRTYTQLLCGAVGLSVRAAACVVWKTNRSRTTVALVRELTSERSGATAPRRTTPRANRSRMFGRRTFDPASSSARP
jgi:hypothetical protein